MTGMTSNEIIVKVCYIWRFVIDDDNMMGAWTILVLYSVNLWVNKAILIFSLILLAGFLALGGIHWSELKLLQGAVYLSEGKVQSKI